MLNLNLNRNFVRRESCNAELSSFQLEEAAVIFQMHALDTTGCFI